jgi:hypothetical protein
MYKQMEGKTIYFTEGWAHPSIVEDVGNSTPVKITVKDGYAKYKNSPIKLSAKGWHSLYAQFLENRK